MSKNKKETVIKRVRLQDLSPEQLREQFRRESELMRERLDEADRIAQPALRCLLESLEQEDVEDESDEESD